MNGKPAQLVLISAFLAIIALIGCSQPSSGGGSGANPPPGEVTLLTQEITSETSLEITWIDPSDGDFNHVDVAFGIYGSGTSEVFSVPAGEETFAVFGLETYSTYEILIRSVDDAGAKSSGITVLLTPDASAVDGTAPAITSTLPADGAGGVDVDTSFTVKFSEAMVENQAIDPVRYNILSDMVDDPALESDPVITWDADTESVTLDFTASLSHGATYTVEVDNEMTDLAGNGLSGTWESRRYSFTTVDGDTVAAPAFSLPDGVYSSDLSIEITCGTPDATIYYVTFDAGEPPLVSESSLEYSGPIVIDGDNSPLGIAAKAFKSPLTPSEQVVSTFEVVYPQAFPPSILPEAEIFSEDTSFTLDFTSPDDGVEYFYEIDYLNDSHDDKSAVLYNPLNPPTINLDSDTERVTVRAEANGDGYEESEVNTVIYGLEYPGAAAPEFSPEHETSFIDSMDINISCASPEMTVHYTLNGGTEQTMAGGGSFTIDGDDAVYDGDDPVGIVEINAWTTATGLKPSSVALAAYYKVNALRGILSVPTGDIGKDVALFLIPDSSFYNDPDNWYNVTVYEDVSGDFTFAVPTLDVGEGLLCAAASDNLEDFYTAGDSFGYYDDGTSLPEYVTLDSSEVTGLDFSLKDDHDLIGTWHAVGPGVEYSTDWGLLTFTNTATGFENLGVPEQMGLMVAAWDNDANWIVLRYDDSEDDTPFDIYSWSSDPDPDLVLAFPDGGEGFATEAAAFAALAGLTPMMTIYDDYADLPVTAAPSFFPPSGSRLVAGESVTVNCSSEDAFILITGDGTEPGYANEFMEEAADGESIILEDSTVLKALAFTETEKISPVTTASYQVYDNAVSGMLSMPAGSYDVTVFLDDNEDFRDGWIDATTLIGASNGTPYTLYTNLEVGDYYICAATWSNQPAGPSTGDLFGAHTTDLVYGLPTEISLTAVNQTGINITLDAGPDTLGTWNGRYMGFPFTLDIGLMEVDFNIPEGVPEAQDMSGTLLTWNNSEGWFLYQNEDDSQYNKWGWANLLADDRFDMLVYMDDDMDWDDPSSVAAVTQTMDVGTVYAGELPDASNLGFPGGGSVTINVDFSSHYKAADVDTILIALANADDMANEGRTQRAADIVTTFSGYTATYTFTNLDDGESYYLIARASSGVLDLGAVFSPDPDSGPGTTFTDGSTQTVNLTLSGDNDGGYSGTAASLSGTVDISNMTSWSGMDIIEITLSDDYGDMYLHYSIDYGNDDSLSYEFVNLDPAEDWTLRYGYMEYSDWGWDFDSVSIPLDPLNIGPNTQDITIYDANDGAYPGGTGIHGSIDLSQLTSTTGLDIIDVRFRADSADQELMWIVNYSDGDSLDYEFINLNPALTWIMDVMARDDNWDDYGRYWENPVTLTSGSDIVHNIIIQPPEHDGLYAESDAATLSGSVDIGDWAWSDSVDYVQVMLSGVTDSNGSQTLYSWVGMDWDESEHEYEFIWLDPHTTSDWILSATAYNESNNPVASYSAHYPTVDAGNNTYDIAFSE